MRNGTTLDTLIDLGKLQSDLKGIGYWGDIVIRFQGGSIVMIEKHETFRASDFEKFEMSLNGGDI